MPDITAGQLTALGAIVVAVVSAAFGFALSVLRHRRNGGSKIQDAMTALTVAVATLTTKMDQLERNQMQWYKELKTYFRKYDEMQKQVTENTVLLGVWNQSRACLAKPGQPK